jgi:hypothetical protein
VAGDRAEFLAGRYAEVARHLSWIAEFWEDIVSDMSVYHRVDDVAALTITRFLSLAVRLSAYGGVLRARFAATQTAGTASPANVPAAGSVPRAGGGDTPPEVVAAIKRQQFAARYGTDPNAIRWDNDEVYRELVNG